MGGRSTERGRQEPETGFSETPNLLSQDQMWSLGGRRGRWKVGSAITLPAKPRETGKEHLIKLALNASEADRVC